MISLFQNVKPEIKWRFFKYDHKFPIIDKSVALSKFPLAGLRAKMALWFVKVADP